MLVFRTGTESYKGGGNGVQVLGIWVDGGNLHAKKMATGYLRFGFCFPSLLFPCCSSIQNLCDYQTCDLAVRHSERLSLDFDFFFFLF